MFAQIKTCYLINFEFGTNQKKYFKILGTEISSILSVTNVDTSNINVGLERRLKQKSSAFTQNEVIDFLTTRHPV